MHDKLVESLEAMEECCKVVEVESKSWHDFWVVQRAVVRALWVVLTWILRKEKKLNEEANTVTVQPMDVDLGKIVDKEPENFSFGYHMSNEYNAYFMEDGTFVFVKKDEV